MKILKILKMVMGIFVIFLVNSCSFFEKPEGKVEIVSISTTKTDSSSKVHYCTVELKITNTSDKEIYSSTIGLSLASDKRRYYQSLGYDVTIPCDQSVFVSTQYSFQETSDEKEWKIDTAKIENAFFK